MIGAGLRAGMSGRRPAALTVLIMILLWLPAEVGPAGAASPCDDVTEGSLRLECEALWEFYTGLDDPGDLDEDDSGAWPTRPFLEWYGLEFADDQSTVRGLWLQSSGLEGPISPALSRLTNLQSLSLGDNRLSGPIPRAIGRLAELRYFALNDNQLSGSVPAELGALANLTVLSLGSNQLSGSITSRLGRLTNLKGLFLQSNQLSGPLPVELGMLTGLEHLILHSNRLSGSLPVELAQLTNLLSLDLSWNRMKGRVPRELDEIIDNVEFLNLTQNELTGDVLYKYSPPEPTTVPSALEIFSSDPLGLIAKADVYRQHSVGSEVWEVWLCDDPIGDLPVEPNQMTALLNREITPYFRWLSNNRYRPTFEYAGTVEGDSQAACERAAQAVRSSGAPMIVIDDSGRAGGYAAGGRTVVVGGTSVVTAPGWPRPLLAVVAHLIGHHLGFPRSYGGNIRWRNGSVYEGDNPMDLMSGTLRVDLTTSTIAVNRYAAGWIDPASVRIHEAGATVDYELRPPGTGGVQMIVLPGRRQGNFTMLGARSAVGYDTALPRQGVEVYRITQSAGACSNPSDGVCWGTSRRTQPFPPAEAGAGYGEDLYSRGKSRLVDHVFFAGDIFEVGEATVEVLERVGNNYMVRVVDESEPEPAFEGRFSDDDGNGHEANIEAIAGLGITLGCNPPTNDRYCPSRLVTRAQMMAFLARALGESQSDSTGSRFSDVADDAWYRGFVERLADLGVVEAYEDGTFRPEEPLTRLDMAVFLTRAFSGITAVGSPAGVFNDIPADAEHAGEVEGILAAGVTRGCSADPLQYCPDAPVPRDQMASFLGRALQAQQAADTSS